MGSGNLLFTWYDRLHVEELCTVNLHSHGPLVQHPYIISKQTPSIMIINDSHSCSLQQTQYLKIGYFDLLAEVVAFQGPCSKVFPNIGQSI